MKSLYITATVCILMAALIPISPSFALSKTVLPFGPHFLYMFAHANLLHWTINSWTLLVLHNTFRWHRLLAAYFLAVAISLCPAVLPPGHPVMGASVITTFFFGLIIPHLWHRNRIAVWMMLALLALGCVLPGFALWFHIIPFTVGFIYIHIERIVRSFIAFSH